ncbi:MAG: hypothetical protein U9N61_08840 [Euryarchaeota archaeon]|nr:hypothetical protein [Euryarchaeota archaeon]
MTEHNDSAAFTPANRSLEGDLSMPLPEGQGITSGRVFCRVSRNPCMMPDLQCPPR